MHLKIPPILVMTVDLAAMALLATATPQFVFAIPAASYIGAAIGVVGVVICVMGVLSFRRARTTVDPYQPKSASALVDGGIYRLSRNPMYLGFLCVVLGYAVHLSHLVAMIVGPLLLVVYLNRFQIAPEEQALGQLFGARYEAYCDTVRRWI